VRGDPQQPSPELGWRRHRRRLASAKSARRPRASGGLQILLGCRADPGDAHAKHRRGRFDLVYSGLGSLAVVTTWRSGSRHRRDAPPGGDFLLYEEHPVALCVDGLMHWRESYFDEGARRLGRIVTTAVQPGSPFARWRSTRAQRQLAAPRRPRAGTFLLYAQRA
jgi:hypothetical protein